MNLDLASKPYLLTVGNYDQKESLRMIEEAGGFVGGMKVLANGYELRCHWPLATAEPAERESLGLNSGGDISTDRPNDLSAPLPTPAVAPMAIQTPAQATPEPERTIEQMLANIQERARINRRDYAIRMRSKEARLPHAD